MGAQWLTVLEGKNAFKVIQFLVYRHEKWIKQRAC
jgi:hypothetical protein